MYGRNERRAPIFQKTMFKLKMLSVMRHRARRDIECADDPTSGPTMTDNPVYQDWQALSDNIRKAIEAGWANGMPPLASALYGRWWQLKSWLRTVLYVELRAKLGSDWVNALPEASEKRQRGEKEFRYMVIPDAQNILAYTDVFTLFTMTSEHWELFDDTLLSKKVWAGRVEELLAIRNRIGHCRRPHTDDLIRLEQTLRDLN